MMRKKTISLVLTLCLLMMATFSVNVFATVGIELDKAEYTVSEKVKATIKGLHSGHEDDGTWIGLAKEGTRYSNTAYYMYTGDLPLNNVFEFDAPSDFGKYVVRVLDVDDNLLAEAYYLVVGAKAKEGDVKVSLKEALLLQPMAVTINGLTDEMIRNGAWFGISRQDEKLENTMHEAYVADMDANNTYKFDAPPRFGKYEVRVFSSYGLDPNEAFFGKTEFSVVSSKAKPGDIVLSKTSVQPEETMKVIVNGLTPGEIAEGAWLGIARHDEKLYNTPSGPYISDLKIGNVYEFEAPYEAGKYEVRVFCQYGLEEEEFEYGMFGKAEFIVGGAPAPKGEIVEGYEGLHSWHVDEVNVAKKENLVTDKVLSEFPKDITREEFCELAVLLYEKMTGNKAVAATNPFSDTKNPEILKAYNLKIVGGVGEGKFAPNNKVTRQEIAAMLLRTLQAVMPNINIQAEFKTKFQDERDIASWALDSVKFMNSNDIIKGSEVGGVSYILPKGNTTREQAIALVLRIFNTFNKL